MVIIAGFLPSKLGTVHAAVLGSRYFYRGWASHLLSHFVSLSLGNTKPTYRPCQIYDSNSYYEVQAFVCNLDLVYFSPPISDPQPLQIHKMNFLWAFHFQKKRRIAPFESFFGGLFPESSWGKEELWNSEIGIQDSWVRNAQMSIKLRFPRSPRKASILKILYWSVQFILILGRFRKGGGLTKFCGQEFYRRNPKGDGRKGTGQKMS